MILLLAIQPKNVIARILHVHRYNTHPKCYLPKKRLMLFIKWNFICEIYIVIDRVNFNTNHIKLMRNRIKYIS